MEALATAFINALLAIAAAINNLAAHQGASPTNVTNIAVGKAETPGAASTAAKPGGGGGNAASLAKAREAAAAKKKAEQEASAAQEQADLSLLDGGDAPAVTLEMLRNKGMEILKAKKQPEMKELLTSLGAASITALAEDKYQEAYDGLEGILSM